MGRIVSFVRRVTMVTRWQGRRTTVRNVRVPTMASVLRCWITRSSVSTVMRDMQVKFLKNIFVLFSCLKIYRLLSMIRKIKDISSGGIHTLD